MSESLISALLGGSVFLGLFSFPHYLKVKSFRYIAFTVAIVLAVVSFLLMDDRVWNGRWLLLPLSFLIYFHVLRLIFIAVFKNEPIVDRYSHVKLPSHYRKMHFGDLGFTMFVFGLSFMTVALIG
jgi:hypothetical protein